MSESPLAASVFDVDAAVLGVLPEVKIRGERYRVADFGVQERLRRRRAYLEVQDRLTQRRRDHARELQIRALLARAEEPDPALQSELERLRAFDERQDEADWRAFKVQGIALLLEGVPDDVAADLTEREFEAVQVAVGQARAVPVTEVPEKKSPAALSSPTPSSGGSESPSSSGSATPPAPTGTGSST